MPCVFDESCIDSTYGTLTVNLSDPAYRLYCHSCGVRGNLLRLIHGLQNHTPPSGGRLRGDEFKLAVTVLRSINGNTEDSPPPQPPTSSAPSADDVQTSPADPPPENIPLKDQERTRNLVNLWEDCIVNVAEMSPQAAAYFWQRPWLTPEVCRKWKMGYRYVAH